MKVRSYRLKVNGSYRVTVVTEEFSEQELKWMREQEEPDIALGGVFDDGGPNEFTLDTTYAKVKTGLAYPGKVEIFDPAVTEDADEKAIIWETEIVTRVLAAMVALKDAESNGFNGETVATPNYA